MTAKRFFIRIDKKNGVGLFDGDLQLMYIQFNNIEDAKSCEDALIYQCNLMNELHDECEFLKIDNEALEDGATKYAELYHKSLKENEQLKQSYKEFEDECQSTFNAMSRKQNDLYRKNFKLKEENEQFKQQLRNSIKLIKKDTATILELEEEIKELKGDVE